MQNLLFDFIETFGVVSLAGLLFFFVAIYMIIAWREENETEEEKRIRERNEWKQR